jgi:hypothetical protein
MRTKFSAIILSSMLAVSAVTFAGAAYADQVTIVGPITKIQLAADGKSAIAVLKDNKTGEAVTISITDDLTLDKFKDKRIVTGDEIRTKFEKKDGKNDSKIFKKTAGC